MIWGPSLVRHLSLCLIALLILPVEAFPLTGQDAGQQVSPATQPAQQNTPAPAPPAQNSIDPAIAPPPVAPAPAQSSPAPATDVPLPQNAQPAAQAPSQNPNAPSGTAAAPETRPLGVPASTPSGAAIAPAKQRRVRKFSIRTAIIIGAVVAVGVVVGASLASPSKASK